MKTFITQNELGRRLGLAPATLKLRLRNRAIEADAVVVNGGKTPGILFDANALPSLRRTLTSPEPEIQ